MADQTPTYRATPISQRDGSALANSNCRMASIATGLDYDTHGAKRSTGSKMRSYQDDQSGGTDSGDAKQAWSRGYSETLTVRDGSTFDDALADLRAGRLIHLDVWHATVGGPCLSGSGAYGHTMAVAPDCSGGSWLVADPWCSPAKWSRVTESKLRAGAEHWGGQVYSLAALEADYPTDGPGPRDPRVLAIVARIVRRLMDRHYPGQEADDTPQPPDTGGGQPILYTVTVARDLEDDYMDLYAAGRQARTLPAGTPYYDRPGGTKMGEIGNPNVVYTLVAQDAPMGGPPSHPSWYLIDGNGGASGPMRWVYWDDLD